MELLKKKRRSKRWIFAWSIALFLHALLFLGISLNMKDDSLIAVSAMIPPPDETLALYPAQAIRPAIFFTNHPKTLNPKAATLYRIESDGSQIPLSVATIHADKPCAIQFMPLSDDGTYEIVIEPEIVSAPLAFDGEKNDAFPSGDGIPGGTFRAKFQISHKEREIFTATLYDANKPQINEESASSQKTTPPRQTENVLKKADAKRQKDNPKRPAPPKKHSQNPPQPKEIPKSAAVEAPISPMQSPSTASKGTVLTPQNLAVGPLNLAPALMHEAAEQAENAFLERDVNRFVQAANLEKSRYDAAYNPEGPIIKPGQQGNSVAHQKNVAEYLALMHKEIHQLWAHDYLLRLDTVFRSNNPKLSNPDLETVLEITLNARGDVTDIRIVRSSGISEYDNEAIHVAWNASPKIPIPNEMRSNNGKSYVHWTFWRDQRQCGVFGVKVFKYEGSQRDALDFSLKAVQIQEKKLGLTPSTIPNAPTTQSAPSSHTISPHETINPLDD